MGRPLPSSGAGAVRPTAGGTGVCGVSALGRAGPFILEGQHHGSWSPHEASWAPAALDPSPPYWNLQSLQHLDCDQDHLEPLHLLLLWSHPGPFSLQGMTPVKPPAGQLLEDLELDLETCYHGTGPGQKAGTRWLGPGLGLGLGFGTRL